MRGKDDLAELHRIALQTGGCSGFENLTFVSYDVHSRDNALPQPQ